MQNPLRRFRKLQEVIFNFTKNRYIYGLQVQQRVGKNLPVIKDLIRKGSKGPVLVVGPTSVFNGWIKDIRLEPIKIRHYLIPKTKAQRTKFFEDVNEDKFSIYIINKESWVSCPEIRIINWWGIVIDESRWLAPNTNTSKFFLKNFRKTKIRIVMSGTMDYKNKLDYYNQIAFLDSKLLPYKNFWHFRNTAFNMYGFNTVMKKNHKKLLMKCINDNFITLNRDGGRVKEFKTINFKLPRRLRKVYDNCEKNFAMEYKGNYDSTIWATTRAIWLMRLCGGFIDTDFVFNEKWKWIQNFLYEYMNKNGNEPVVILCRFKREIYKLIELLREEFHWLKTMTINGDVSIINRGVVEAAFQAGQVDIFVCESSCIARGKDLSRSKTLIYYSQPNGKEVKDQVDDRLITMDDEEVVTIYNLIVSNSIDEDYLNVCKGVSIQNLLFQRVLKNG